MTTAAAIQRDPFQALGALQRELAQGVIAADALLAGEPVPCRLALARADRRLKAWHRHAEGHGLADQVRAASAELSVVLVAASVCTAGRVPGAPVGTHLRTARRVIEDVRRQVAHQKFRVGCEPILREAMPHTAAYQRAQQRNDHTPEEP